MQNQKRVIRVSRKAAIFIGIIIALAIIAWAIFLQPRGRIIYDMMGGNTGQSITLPEAPSSTPGMAYPDSMPYYRYDSSSAKDTREFMKVYYNTEIKTRDVKDTARDVKGAIRDADGRIDNLNESPKYVYISFVVPKSKFENFKEEIESLAHEKLVVENTSSENLLGRKQYIEEQEENATSELARLKKELADLDASHVQTVKTLQNSVNANALELIRVRDAMAKTSDPAERAALKAQETNLINSSAALTQNLNSVNKNYNSRNQDLKNQIENTEKMLENIPEQYEDFTDNVETVNGSVSIQWVSVWQLAKIFSPIHPAWEIIILLLVVGYFLKRKNYLPGVEFV